MHIITTARVALAFITGAALLVAFFFSPIVASASNTYSVQTNRSSGQYLSVADSPSLSVTGDISVEAWIKPASLAPTLSYYIATKGTTDQYNAWRLMAHWNAATLRHNLVFTTDETGNNAVAVAYSYADADLASYVGSWVHVAATWDATSGTAAPKLYINGTEVPVYFTQGNDGGTNAIADTDSPTYIGNSPNQAFFFDGNIDDVRVWNVERTPSEINANYNQELIGNESGLVAYWKLNNDNGNDYTSNNNDLTAVSGPTYTTDVPFLNDSTPPSTNVTNPTEASTVSGTISLTANATDDVGVAGVQFKVDGNNLGIEDTSAPYSVSLDTTTLAEGSHTVFAVARDTSNNTATSSVVNFTVNNVAPYVPILKVRKTANESLVSSSTTQADDHLKLALEGGKTYIIDGVIFATAVNGTPDIKINFGGAGVTIATIGYTNDGSQGVLANNATSPVIQLTATPEGIHIHGTVVTTANGDFQLKWAQNTSNVNATSVLLGSYLRAEEI